ncbi:MAG: sugar phosphate nucleotidyltransferase [Bacteriovorax sp.]|nr:sugar phosphate nucleotidyltransferase [Bacteriovorax sp.]
MNKAAILAAGDGLRIKSIAPYKPIVKINGTPLLELTLKNLHFKNFKNICIIFNEAEKEMDLSLLPGLSSPGVNYFFKSTPSSMHSLYEVAQKLELKSGEHLFVSMVDSIVIPLEAQNFHQFCLTLKSDESALLVTSFIEDEKPLTLKINEQGYITEFQCPIEDGVLITSGVYYFSENIFPLLLEMINEGQTKMRNFLTELVKHNHKIKIFESLKTLDIDRPEDIHSAEAFLKGQAL